MTILIMWLICTMLVAGLIASSARWLGPTILVGAYSASLISAIVIAGKLGVVPGFPELALSASIFVYSATFVFTDVLSEVYGVRTARRAVFVAACGYPILLVSTYFSTQWAPHPTWGDQIAFETTFGVATRVLGASACAFVFSQFHDVWAFHFWKRLTTSKDESGITRSKHLWLRNNLSTIVSQSIDTVVFYSIAFYGIFPIGRLILLTMFVKIIIAIVDTPLVYFVVWFISKDDRNDTEECISQ